MIALYLLILVDSISATVIIPLLGPLLIDQATLVFLPDASLPLRNFVSGLLVATYVVFMFYMAPVLGRLSDQWGRRPVLLLCAAGLLLGNILAGLAIEFGSLALLFLGRMIGGATAAAQSTAQAALVDSGGNKARLLSYSMLFSSLGFVLGPVLATGLSQLSFAAPLHFCTFLTVIALILLARYREEPEAERRIDWSGISLWEGVRCFRDAAGDGLVRGILACFILMQVAWGGFFVFVSVYLLETPGLDLTLSQVGVFMAIIGIGCCVSNGLVQPMLAERFDMRTLAVTGLGLNAATMALCLIATSPYQAYAAGLMAGITINIAYPSIVTMLSDRVTPERQGWILGMVGSAAAMGWAISSVVSGGLGGLGHALPIVLAAVLMACAALAMTAAGARWRNVSEAQGKFD